MTYHSETIKKDLVTINGQFGVYSFVDKLNKQKKTGEAVSKVVQLKISCGGETLVHYRVSGNR